MSYDYEDPSLKNIIFSKAFELETSNDYIDDEGFYHFKMQYSNSIFRHQSLYFKQKNNPFINDDTDNSPQEFTFIEYEQTQPSDATELYSQSIFTGLQYINDNISVAGMNNDTDSFIFRIGQYASYKTVSTYTFQQRNEPIQQKSMIPAGGIIGPVEEITHTIPRISIEHVRLYARNHRKCQDWRNDCYLLSIQGQCSTDTIAQYCRYTCRLCSLFVSRTDVVTVLIGSSTEPEVSNIVTFENSFFRKPTISNIFLYYNQASKDDGIDVSYAYEYDDVARKTLYFQFTSNSDDGFGWSEELVVQFHAYEEWSPICTYHDDVYCAERNRGTCSTSYFDNTCLECLNGFIDYNNPETFEFGTSQCNEIEPDQIVLIPNDDNYIYEGEATDITLSRVSAYNTTALGKGYVILLYTLQHWETDANDFEVFSGTIKWIENDTDAKTISITAIADELYETEERFWIKFMIYETDVGITMNTTTFEMVIFGPNDVDIPNGEIVFYDANMEPLNTTNTTIVIEEQDITLDYYVHLNDSSNICKIFYTAEQDTAIQGMDFMAVNSSITFYKYDIELNNTFKPFSVTIYDDDVWEVSQKKFYLTIWQSYGVSVPIDTITFIILDNDSVMFDLHILGMCYIDTLYCFRNLIIVR